MKLTRVKNLLNEISQMELPISDTLKGKLVHQTTRNNLTNQLKEALYEDFAEELLQDGEIIPYLIKEGVILEVPNASVANAIGPNDMGSGALSIEFGIAIKGLDVDANELASEFDFKKQLDAQKKAQTEKIKAAQIEKSKVAREQKKKARDRVQALVDQIAEKH